jgi:hypothetical protein
MPHDLVSSSPSDRPGTNEKAVLCHRSCRKNLEQIARVDFPRNETGSPPSGEGPEGWSTIGEGKSINGPTVVEASSCQDDRTVGVTLMDLVVCICERRVIIVTQRS